jgi:hypothetical protein
MSHTTGKQSASPVRLMTSISLSNRSLGGTKRAVGQSFSARAQQSSTASPSHGCPPEFVPAKWWQELPHGQTAWLVRTALLCRRCHLGFQRTIIDVPYHLER